MKLKIKNPVLRWLAGCGSIIGAIGAIGVILWIIGWLANLIPGYYEGLYAQKTAAVPFNFVVLGLLTACGLVIAILILIGLFHGAKGIGNHYFDP